MKLARAEASVPGRGRMGRRAPLILGSVHGTRFVMDGGGFQTSARATPHRTMTTISSLEPLVGGHPHALADFYRAGRPCDPSSVRSGEGHLLAFDALANAHAAARPIVTLLGKHFSPWRGKAFESGGTAGTNLLFGKRLARSRERSAAGKIAAAPESIYHVRWKLPRNARGHIPIAGA